MDNEIAEIPTRSKPAKRPPLILHHPLVIRSDDGGPVPILEICGVHFGVDSPTDPLGADVVLGFREGWRFAFIWFHLGDVSVYPRGDGPARALPPLAPDEVATLRHLASGWLNGGAP